MFGDLTTPPPGGIKGSPQLENPNFTFKASNPQIKKTHKEILDQNELLLILDIW
jgi:hypothetical protein